MTATLIQTPDRVVFQNLSWHTYQFLITNFESEPAICLIYERGTLAIRMPLTPHETYKKLLGRLIEAATEELNLEIRSSGAHTCDRKDLARGLEPDQCCYIQNEVLVRDIEQIDLAHFLTPNLAVEVNITSSSLDQFSIYTSLGVPEIWRCDGRSLTMYWLDTGKYKSCDRSIALLLLMVSEMIQFLELRLPKQETQTPVGENSISRFAHFQGGSSDWGLRQI
jgi:Uma2 family endonuclease